MDDFITVITPAFNSAPYIHDTIKSVINQSYKNWELLIVNNNSTDDTEAVVKSFSDKRIKLFFERKQGVGFARNLALSKMKGNYFCFLDADDVLPEYALESRLKIFLENEAVDFVDGGVDFVNESMSKLAKNYRPSFKGKPYDRLLSLDSRCLFGNTWMVKRDMNEKYEFQTDMTHAEDLFFYLTISKGKFYDYTSETILLYRQRDNSAMKDINGLESGYLQLINKIKTKLGVSSWIVIRLKLKITKIMVLSHLFDGRDVWAAFKVPFKILGA